MLLRIASFIIYLIVFVPVSIVRKVSQSSAYGQKAHQKSSAWDLPNHD